jgi:hypothetical protein
LVEREHWIKVVSWLLSYYPDKGTFTVCERFLGNPYHCDPLNARIDLWRALKKCQTVEEIVDYLGMVEEGWFYEKQAEIREAIEQVGKEAKRRGAIS